MKSLSDSIKSVVIVILVLLLCIAASMRLMKIQIVGGNDIKTPEKNNSPSYVYTKNVLSTRGEIIDYNGNLIVGNTACMDIVLQKAQFPEDNADGNSILLEIHNELSKRGYAIEENIPISNTKPYYFTSKETEELKSDLSLNVYATADNCIDKLIADYEISDKYSDQEKRIIAGLRYELMLRDFSYSNDFVLARDVDSDTVIEMKELGNVLRGVNAVQSATREILVGNVIPHEIGTVGPIYAEEYAELKDKGYALNDVVGKSGIELAMETQLRGQVGSQEITVQNNSVTNVKTLTEAVAGSTVKLTVNSTYQVKLQKILDDFLANFHNINQKPELSNVDVECGAIVVLDAKSGAVRGMVTAPTYDLIAYAEDYEAILGMENSPLVNRATDGLYRPGSTFKTITATAGLNEGIVDGESTYRCEKEYIFHDHPYKCTGTHYDIAVTKALQVSCNIYFYELSQKLTIDNITKYAQLYGLGEHTGLETGDAAGYLANPETFRENGQPWYIGYVLQAGIGNIDCGMTPLQMACVANTIANEGIRYKPYLVDSLCDYGTYAVTARTEPVISEQIELNYDYVYDYIEDGMIAASLSMPERYSLANLGFDVAIKTGTPQVGNNNEQNSFFIGYAPAENPEIAFAGVIEGGEYSKYMIRDIILAYQECYGLNGIGPTITNGTVTGTGTETGTGTDTDVSGTNAQTVTETVQTENGSYETTIDVPAEPETEATEPSAPISTEAQTEAMIVTEAVTTLPSEAPEEDVTAPPGQTE